MRVLAFIEEAPVIRKILDHLGLWDVPKRQPQRGRGPPVIVEPEPLLVYADSQVIEYEEASTSRNTMKQHEADAADRIVFVPEMVKMWCFALQQAKSAGEVAN